MHVSNFGVDKCGNTVLLDFANDTGNRPIWAKYTMKPNDDFIARVADLLRWPDNSNLRSMLRVSSCLWMVSNPKLGATTCA